MSTNSDSRDGGRKEIRDIISEAEHTLHRHNIAALKYANRGQDPQTTDQVQELLTEVHGAVLVVYTRLRPYIKEELHDDYWHTTDYPLLTPNNLDNEAIENDNYRAGLEIVDDWYKPIRRQQRVVDERHNAPKRVTDVTTDLFPESVYRRILHLLSEAAVRLKFLPEAEKTVPHTEITEEDIEEVEEWRQQNLNR